MDKKSKGKHALSLKGIFLALIMICLGVGIAKIGFDYVAPALVKASPQKPPVIQPPAVQMAPSQPIAKQTVVQPVVNAPTPETKPTPKPAVAKPNKNFVLQGIFTSGYNQPHSALINNKIVQEGDKVNSAVVKKISFESVELVLNDGQVIKLINR